MAKFGGHVLHHLASRLVNIMWEGGRDAGMYGGREGGRELDRQTKT